MIGQVAFLFTFAGNQAFSARVLASALQLPSDPEEEGDLADSIKSDLREFYNYHGFIYFRVTELSISLGRPTHVFCEVSEGNQFTFSNISVAALDEELVRAFEQVPVGSPANMILMRRLSQQLREKKQGDGFFDFNISVELRMSPTELDFTANVEPGQRYVIGQVSIPPGLAELDPLQFLTGQPYSRSVLEFYLNKAGLPWKAVQLRKDFWDAIVDIEINPPIMEESGS